MHPFIEKALRNHEASGFVVGATYFGRLIHEILWNQKDLLGMKPYPFDAGVCFIAGKPVYIGEGVEGETVIVIHSSTLENYARLERQVRS